jgi:trehalose 6-phosphate phosphatase
MTASDLRPLPAYDARFALFLDVDGTLLRLAETPDAVEPDLELCALIERLTTFLNGALALVSGRQISDLLRFFPGLTVAMIGLHGAVIKRAGAEPTVVDVTDHAAFREAVGVLQNFAAGQEGVIIEDKRVSVALHYRRNPRAADDCRTIFDAVLQKLKPDYAGIEGNMVFEIRPAKYDKGAAIAFFMEESPFRTRHPIFCGDDTTDEDGFAVVNRLGGASIKVGPGESCAVHRLDDVAAVHAWLAGYLEFFERGNGGRNA